MSMSARAETRLTRLRGRWDGSGLRPYLQGHNKISFQLTESSESVHDMDVTGLLDDIERIPHLHDEYVWVDGEDLYSVKTLVRMECQDRVVADVRLDAKEWERAAFWLEFTMDARVPGLAL